MQPKFEDVCPNIARAVKYVRNTPFVEIDADGHPMPELP